MKILIYVLILLVSLVTGRISAQSKLPDSPSGIVAVEKQGKILRSWYFCPNGNLQIIDDVHPEKSVSQGTWKLKKDTVYYSITFQYGKRGIGEPWIREKHKGFNDYADFVNEIQLDSFLLWKVKEPQQLVIQKTEYKCTESFYVPFLPGNYPVASYRLLEEKDLRGLSVDQLQQMKIEIYARYGFKFNYSEANNYLSKEEWYFASRFNVDHMLTNVEKRNIKTIEAYIRIKNN